MSIVRILMLAALALPGAFAQSWSQPVREMEKAARSGAQGTCSVSLPANHNTGNGTCVLRAQDGSELPSVPAGKVLVVEEASAFCESVAGELIARLSFAYSNAQGASYVRYIPLTSQGSTTGVTPRTYRAGSVTTRFYAPAGASLSAHAFSASPVSAYTSCSLSYAGHLVSVQ